MVAVAVMITARVFVQILGFASAWNTINFI